MMSPDPGHQEKEVGCFAEKVRANGVVACASWMGVWGLLLTGRKEREERKAGEIGTAGNTAEYMQQFFHFLLKLSILTRLKCFV